MAPARLQIVVSIPAVLWLSAALAQQVPQFEVASVKPTPPDITETSCRQASHVDSDRLSMHCGTLASFIVWAYDLKGGPVEGIPDWAGPGGVHYDVDTKAGSAASPDQMRLMLQALLADRFQLQVHREKPVRPVFALVVAKGGSKLGTAQPGADPGTESQGHVRFTMAGKTMIVTGAGASIQEFIAWAKSIVPDRPIADETGLNGVYDFKLQWLPEEDQPTVAFFTAIQDQMGLKPEDRKVPVEVLVIDHAEKPLPNR